MEVRIALGTEVDIATSGELRDGLSGLEDNLLRKGVPPKPTYTSRPQAGTMPNPNTTPLFLDLGSPPTGRMWNILALTTFGVDDATVTANAKVALYCGDIQNVSLVQLKVPAATIPTFQSFNKDVLWCLDRETMFARITGAAADAPMGVIVQVAEWRECDVVARSGR